MLQRHLNRRSDRLRQHQRHRNLDLGSERERCAGLRSRHGRLRSCQRYQW
jgi:hypothetical protein